MAAGRESFDHPTGRNNDIWIGWKLSIHGYIQLELKIDLPGSHVGTQILEEPDSNSFNGMIEGIPNVRFS